MKNIYTILEEIGLALPEEKKADFDKAFGENYKTIADYNRIKDKGDNLQTDLDDVKGKLSAFEGVDIDDLKGQIANLTKSLSDKDTEYQQKEAQRQFDEVLSKALADAKAKNPGAVRGLLNIEELMKSSNRDKDIADAIAGVKTSDAYMFESDEPINNKKFVGKTGGSLGGESSAMDALRGAFGLPPKKD